MLLLMNLIELSLFALLNDSASSIFRTWAKHMDLWRAMCIPLHLRGEQQIALNMNGGLEQCCK